MAMSAGNGGGFGEETEYRPISEINITPMVDVMLVLLIIFMVTAPLLVAGVPVELPNTSAARISQPKKPVIVSLGGDGSLYIRDEQVRQETLIPKLRALRSAEGDAVVYVRADKKRAYGRGDMRASPSYPSQNRTEEVSRPSTRHDDSSFDLADLARRPLRLRPLHAFADRRHRA